MNKAVKTNSIEAWIKASRPKTLGAMCCPVLIGTAFAVSEKKFHFAYFLITIVCSLLLQILANLINDYGDFLKGSDGKDRLGPPRAMQMGWITKKAMERGIAVNLLIICVLGSILSLRGGWPILLSGLVGIFLCGWYTLGKKPLAYLGFSEVVILLVFGPGVVVLTYYLQTLDFSREVIAISISPGLLSTALILTNNLRDINEDRKNKKRTIAVRFGEKFARIAIVTLVIFANVGPVILVLKFSYSPLLLLACIPLVLPARYFLMILQEPVSAKFNLMLASIGQSLYRFGIFLGFLIINYGTP